MPATLSHRTTWTAPDGSPFHSSGVYQGDDPVSAVVHFTAPIGTTFAKVLDVSGKAGEDNFGAIGGASYVLLINRTDEAITVRMDGATAGGDAFVVLEAGRWIGIAQPAQVITSTTKGTKMASISVKATSKAGTVEVLACTMGEAEAVS